MNASDYYEFFSQPRFISGIKALENIPFELTAMNAKKPIIITDKKTSKNSLSKYVIKACKDSNIVFGALYDDVPSCSNITTVNELAALYQDRGCDSIIAICSGPVMDIAKGVNIVVSEKSNLLNFKEKDTLTKPLKPLIAIPTGNSSKREICNEAIIDSITFSSNFLFPDITILDPRMTRIKNVQSAVNKALAALTYSIEAIIESINNPLLDSYAYVSIQLAYENLYKVIKKPGNKNVCLALANAASIGDIVYSNSSKGIIQILGQSLSSVTDSPEGIIMGILLCYGLEYKMQNNEIMNDKILLALANFDLYSKTPKNERIQRSIELIRKLLLDINKEIPGSLQQLNIPEYILKERAEKALHDSNNKYKFDDCMLILKHAWEGKSISKGKQ